LRGAKNLVWIIFEDGDELVISAYADKKDADELQAAARRLSVNKLRVCE